MFQRICTGIRGKPTVCKHMDDCKVCIHYGIDSNYDELYGVGRGVPRFCCKRDFLEIETMTESEFIELYNRVKNDFDTIELYEMIDFFKEQGVIKEDIL